VRKQVTAVRTTDPPIIDGRNGERYVFGRLDQMQLSMTTRLSVILTPTVSFQLFT
jgi:hypothetical protein